MASVHCTHCTRAHSQAHARHFVATLALARHTGAYRCTHPPPLRATILPAGDEDENDNSLTAEVSMASSTASRPALTDAGNGAGKPRISSATIKIHELQAKLEKAMGVVQESDAAGWGRPDIARHLIDIARH